MTQTDKLLMATGVALAVPFIASAMFTSPEAKQLSLELGAASMISTAISVPLGLLIVPRASPLLAAAGLTAAGLALSFFLLPHVDRLHGSPALPQGGAA